MNIATVGIFLDKYHPQKNGKCSVKVKITFQRKRRYYSTGLELSQQEFERVENGKRRTTEENNLYTKIRFFENKAQTVIGQLLVFTFDNFETGYFELRNTTNSVSFAFDKYIEQLIIENRIGTAVSYESAKKSLEAFRKDLTFADINPTLLKKYEKWMLHENKSITTIGIYLRSLRTIYNLQSIDKSNYPFGDGKNLYLIPTGKNTKKALTNEDIAKIYKYQTTGGTIKDMAKDYWLFLYLCNGMNVKDFCLLKWNNIEGEFIRYNRAKTNRTNKKPKDIFVALKPEIIAIIKKWGQICINKENYIFPHLQRGMSAKKEHAAIQLVTKMINKYIKAICLELGIQKHVTTYVARHSFATVLKRSNVSIEMISELLGHSSTVTTESYLASFPKEQIIEQTKSLTVGFSAVN